MCFLAGIVHLKWFSYVSHCQGLNHNPLLSRERENVYRDRSVRCGALEKDKEVEKESLPIHRNDSKLLSFILLAAAFVLVLFLTSGISLRGTYTFLIDHDFITTREQRDDVAIQNSKCLEDILLDVVEHESTMLHVRDAAINASSNNPVLYLLIIAVATSSLSVLL